MTEHVPRQAPETNPQNEITEKAVSRAVGEELRQAREASGWSRNYFVTRLPSGIGARTLLSYEPAPRGLSNFRLWRTFGGGVSRGGCGGVGGQGLLARTFAA
jgi:hypothetical protein